MESDEENHLCTVKFCKSISGEVHHIISFTARLRLRMRGEALSHKPRALSAMRTFPSLLLFGLALVGALAEDGDGEFPEEEIYIAGDVNKERWIYVSSPRCCSDCTYVSRGWKCKEKTCLFDCRWATSSATRRHPFLSLRSLWDIFNEIDDATSSMNEQKPD